MTLAITTTGLTGNAHALAEVTAGVNSYGKNIIIGFIWHEKGYQKLAGENRVLIMTEGTIDARDVVLPSGATSVQLTAALRDSGLREKNIIIESLNQRV
jgi:hypothetical protein